MDVSKEYERREYVGSYTYCASVKAAEEANRSYRRNFARQFMIGCIFDNEHKTCVLSPGSYSWFDKSYGITWVGVHGVGDSICVVTGRKDLEMTTVRQFGKTLPQFKVMYRLPGAIMSEIEGLPYDEEFCKRTGHSIKKPFGVVSGIPVTRKSDEETGQLAPSVDYDTNKAINFLKEKLKSESLITGDETIKTAISAFQHLCLQELKAEGLWIVALIGGKTLYLEVNDIEKHLAAISGGSGSSGSSRNKDEMMEDLGVIKSGGNGSNDFTYKVIEGVSSLKVHNDEILI